MQETTSGGAQGGRTDVDFAALPVGARVGRYEIQAVLGQGGFGITYRAHDAQLHRDVAIKEYLPVSLAVRQDGSTVLPRSTKLAEDFGWGRERFVAEGRTLASLHDAPAIVRVFDFMELNGTAYIVMELVRGETLESRLKERGALSADEVDAILWPLLDGLEQVHNAGFLHRDIKPANILLRENGKPALIDFGASRAAMAGRTAAMTAIFTPGYAAAEQMTSARQGPWTDIYGLSATLYHGITGAAPPSAFDRMLDDDYQPLARTARPGFRSGVLAGLDAGLAVRASDRPQSIAGWRGILSLSGKPVDEATRLASQPADQAATMMARRGPGDPPRAQPMPAPAPAPLAESSPPPTPSQPAAGKSRVALYAGAAAAVLLLLAGSGYFFLAPKPAPQVTTAANLQDLKVEDLERALAERRKADAEAAEKRRLEEDAKRKAESDAAAKQAADTELAKAEEARKQAEAELARLKAEIQARRQDQETLARRAEAEAAQRKAEAEMAALRQVEDEARRKAAAEAEAKRLADEALAKAQADRQKADEEARQKAAAEAKEKAEATSKQIAEAEARAKAEADAKAKADAEAKARADADAKAKADADAAAAAEKKAAETAEMALRLAPADRQRVQVALTSLGFDTRGSDGAFGPRSREMIGAWQKASSQPVTGFLNGTQHQALLREAAPALQKHDDEQKKKEEENKRAEDAKKKAEEDAKAKAASAAPIPPQPTVGPAPPVAGPNSFDGRWSGTANLPNGSAQAVGAILRNGTGKGSWRNQRCGGDVVYTITVHPDGKFVVQLDGYNDGCQRGVSNFAGVVQNNTLSFKFSRGAGTFSMSK